MKKRLALSSILALVYVSMGTWELVGNIELSRKVDSVVDGLDLYLIYPAHIVGSLFWWMLGGAEPENVYLAWIGQVLNLLVITIILLIVISIINRIFKKT